jgi:preprotein translocase subunit YajC
MDYGTILMIVAVIALFYFMLIRPQQKRAKEQKTLMAGIKPGDRVMTISGIVGTIRHLGEKQAIIEISPGVEMTVVKGAISTQPVEDEFVYSDDVQGEAEPGDAVSDFDEPAVSPQEPAAPHETASDTSAAWDNPNK